MMPVAAARSRQLGAACRQSRIGPARSRIQTASAASVIVWRASRQRVRVAAEIGGADAGAQQALARRRDDLEGLGIRGTGLLEGQRQRRGRQTGVELVALRCSLQRRRGAATARDVELALGRDEADAGGPLEDRDHVAPGAGRARPR